MGIGMLSHCEILPLERLFDPSASQDSAPYPLKGFLALAWCLELASGGGGFGGAAASSPSRITYLRIAPEIS